MSDAVTSTVETVLKDHAMGHTNVVSEDRWSLVAGSFPFKYRPSARNIWSFKTGALSWQLSLKTGFTVFVCVIML